ncbi:hypothetical protein ACE1SV_28590 [Streptomyces sennicomposti]
MISEGYGARELPGGRARAAGAVTCGPYGPVGRESRRRGDGEGRRRPVGPRALREDLWTARAEPLPPSGRLRRLPHGAVCPVATGVRPTGYRDRRVPRAP